PQIRLAAAVGAETDARAVRRPPRVEVVADVRGELAALARGNVDPPHVERSGPPRRISDRSIVRREGVAVQPFETVGGELAGRTGGALPEPQRALAVLADDVGNVFPVMRGLGR